MKIIILTAFGVGGATIAGAVMGFVFKNIPKRFCNMLLAFATGIMLSSSVFGLIAVSLEVGGSFALPMSIAGIFCGAACIGFAARFIPYILRLLGICVNNSDDMSKAGSVLLFVAAIALHNLPEGIAAGVGFGTGNVAKALVIAGGIALQNLPEGMVIIAPMLAIGIPPHRTLCCAVATGVVEIIGTFIGYYAVFVCGSILPFVLSFAGGTMLYVISDEMIPETHSENCKGTTYSLLAGFCVMMLLDALIG